MGLFALMRFMRGYRRLIKAIEIEEKQNNHSLDVIKKSYPELKDNFLSEVGEIRKDGSELLREGELSDRQMRKMDKVLLHCNRIERELR